MREATKNFPRCSRCKCCADKHHEISAWPGQINHMYFCSACWSAVEPVYMEALRMMADTRITCHKMLADVLRMEGKP